MSSRKLSRITNIWSKVVKGEGGKIFSRIVIEATETFEPVIRNRNGGVLLKADGVVPNMPEGSIEVNDGLVREVLLNQAGPGLTEVSVHLHHPAEWRMEVADGIPFRTIITLDRSFISELFQGRIIVIDPGHGGEDTGARGPVNLVEKNVVLPISLNLKELFEQAGAQVILTRSKDEKVSFKSRATVARDAGADLFISVHTYSNSDSKVGGTAVLYANSCRESLEAAVLVKEELVKKLKLADRGFKERKKHYLLQGVPDIEVEVVTITNWVEEGLLRSPTIHKKAAEGIFNGVKNYFAAAAQRHEVLL